MTTPDAGLPGATCSSGEFYNNLCTAVSTGNNMNTGYFRYPDLAFTQLDFSAGFAWNTGGSWPAGLVATDRPHINPQTAYIDLDDNTTYKALVGVIQGYRRSPDEGWCFIWVRISMGLLPRAP